MSFLKVKQHKDQGRGLRFFRILINKSYIMAQTEAGKKKIYVHSHTKDDGTKVPTHYRSTPNTSKGVGSSNKK